MIADYVYSVWTGSDFFRWNYGDPIGSAANITYSFATQFAPYYYDESNVLTIDGTFSAFNADQRAAAQSVLATYASVANLHFTQVADGESGDITFGNNAQGVSTAGYAFYGGPFGGTFGDVWISNTYSVNFALSPALYGSEYGYLTLVHEIGHSMGLKHSFQTMGPPDEGGNQVVLDAAHDSYQYSVMSYTHQSNELFLRLHAPGTLSSSDYFHVYPTGPSLYDVAALQYLYGANTSFNSGNTTYTFDPASPFFKCLWDGGGKDTLSVSNFGVGCRIDLGEGKFSDIVILPDAIPNGWSGSQPTYDGRNNLSIAFGAVIENATGGAGGDSLTGNNVANVLRGNAGADKLSGLGGGDTLAGGKGKDALSGGAGADKFVFDVAPVNSTPDTIKDFVPGSDKIQLDDATAAFGTAVGPVGALAATAFWAGSAAHDASDRVIYDAVTGNVYYDSDGSGAKAQVLFAVLTGSPDNVGASDFQVI